DRMESLTPSPDLVDMKLMITHIECHPECLVIAFQAQRNTGCEFDYHILENRIQHVFKKRDNICLGGSYLVEDTEGRWHRGIVLGKRGNTCETCLIDTGQVLVVEETHLAAACDEMFQLPPKVVLGVFASILPLGEKWGPKAINYFSSLVGLQVTGHVKAVMLHKLFILEVPKIITDVLELQLGKFIDGDSFCLIVEALRAFPEGMLCKRLPQLFQQKYPIGELLAFNNPEKPKDFWHVPDELFPCLPVGSKENVKITAAVSPNKFYCQLQKWQKELKDLTGDMNLYYEALIRENSTSCDSLGLLCAARRQNGQWHRGVVKQVLFDHVEIWFMDFGISEVVPSSCVQKLIPEFMTLPMISFPCALSCSGSQDQTVIEFQLKELIQALIGQTCVCVRVDLYNNIKCLYYITLQNQNLGINAKHPVNPNEAAASCVSLLETKSTSIAVNCKPCPERSNSFKDYTGDKHIESCLPERDISFFSRCKREEMQMNSFYGAFVVHVISPSDFWIQTCRYQNEFQALMKNIAHTYNQCGPAEMVLEDPEPGVLCCARYSKDGHYYRGVVAKVLCVNVTVCFFDFGNTDTVPCYDVKTLLPEFSGLPALALCCSLAHTFPVEDVWVKKEIDFFKSVLWDKPLLLHVIGKQNSKYIVHVQCDTGLQQRNVAMCMVEAGYAEYWEKTPLSVTKSANPRCGQNYRRCKRGKINAQGTGNICKNKVSGNGGILQKKKSLSVPPVHRESVVLSCFGKGAISKVHKSVHEEKLFYEEFVFKPGAAFEVVCSCIVSPADFSCQLQSKLPELNNLMEQIQTYYKDHTNPYKTGQIACIVKYPKDGKWYRGTVVQQVSTDEVDVVFVDYGYQERVLLQDLQAILPDFLSLESQAFRCGLKNVPLQSDSPSWSEEVRTQFEDFISSSEGPLTCIIYAVILVSPNNLCNVVDLQTALCSAEEFLRQFGPTQSEHTGLRNLASLGSLYSFCYSTFDIKIGSEEEVYITHINSPSEFYCQLNRNTETVEALMKKVSVISEMSNNATYDTSKTRLCIARCFEDGLFYRALVFPVESTSCLWADYVDFGNKSIVERDQLMPIPDSATDLIFTPMQAIKCCLSDLSGTEIPASVTRWFEEKFLGKLIKAVIVSRESDGKIVLELYDGQVKVSQKIKVLKDLAQKNCMQQFTSHEGVDSKEPDVRNTVGAVLENREEPLVGEIAAHSLPHPALNSEGIAVNALSESHNARLNCAGQQERSNKDIPILMSLPQRDIPVNTEVAAYISHMNSPSSFYVYLAKDENLIIQLGDDLNESVKNQGLENCLDDLVVGDLIAAEHGADCFYYRAVIKTLKLENSFEVEFIDYGNSAVVSSSKIYRIPEKFLSLPRFSVHCFLSNVQSVSDESWSRKSASYFARKVSNKQVACKFLQQHGEQWEIDVICDGKSMSNDFLQEIERRRWQNTPCRRKNRPRQNGSPEDRKSRIDLDYEEFYVQLLKNSQILHELNVMLDKAAQRSDLLRVDDIKKGLECMTQSGRNFKWYRSKVIKKFVRENDEMRSIPKQAVCCRWIWFENLKEVQFVHVVNAFLDGEIKVLFLRFLKSFGVWEIDILIEKFMLQEYLNQPLSHCQTVVGPEKSSNTNCKEFNMSFKIDSVMWMQLQRSRVHPGFATAVTDPSNFSIQFEVFFDCMQNLSLLLSDLPDSLPVLSKEHVTPGVTCLIKFEQWNRAKISEVTSQTVVLIFIDYGFLKSIPYSEIHKLKVIPESMSYLPCLAHACSLHAIVPAKGEHWSDEAKQLFQKLLSTQGLIFHVIHYGSEMKLEVDILYEDTSVADALVAAGHAV
ncbi:Tudor domain-containing protein 15, partial [Acanthisitta chloris]